MGVIARGPSAGVARFKRRRQRLLADSSPLWLGLSGVAPAGLRIHRRRGKMVRARLFTGGARWTLFGLEV